MFASVALALRIDAAEARLSRSVALGLPAAGDGDGGPFAMPIGAGFGVFAKPGSPVNKVIGLGIDVPIEEGELVAIEEAVRARGEDTRVELATLARPDVCKLLTGRGYQLHGFENVLGLDLGKSARAPQVSGIAVDVVADGALSPWLDVLVDGFSVPDDTGVPAEMFPRAIIEEVTKDFARSVEVRRYVARIGAEAAGSASMRPDGGVAAMCGASTIPAFRRRGVQQALLSRRVDDARAAGCDIAVVTTAPGTRSQSNAERRGFRLLYARAVLVRPARP
jgi:GNAT superfamily N-acetyltransferase